MLKPVSAIAAVMFATALLTPTVSQAEEARTASISYADLNLANQHGRSVLSILIAAAATQLCYNGALSRELEMAQIARSCRVDAIASAQPAYDAAVAAARRGTVTVLTGAALTVTAQSTA